MSKEITIQINTYGSINAKVSSWDDLLRLLICFECIEDNQSNDCKYMKSAPYWCLTYIDEGDKIFVEDEDEFVCALESTSNFVFRWENIVPDKDKVKEEEKTSYHICEYSDCKNVAGTRAYYKDGVLQTKPKYCGLHRPKRCKNCKKLMGRGFDTMPYLDDIPYCLDCGEDMMYEDGF